MILLPVPQWLVDHRTGLIYVLQWGLFGFFMTPLAEVAFMIFGYVWYALRFKRARHKFSKLIIQITTLGHEPELVRDTLRRIQAYGLPKYMNVSMWVIVEPGYELYYPEADMVSVVPSDFEPGLIGKARALEWSRRLRRGFGFNTNRVKILFVDDDTIPTKGYIITAFDGDYHLCQGITVPSREYASGPFVHWVISHLDNIRTRNCLAYCSTTQGTLQKPLFVHGEGLCITGDVEDAVQWLWPIVASDDLVFGTNAAAMGYSWGFFYRSIQLVSPWTWKENEKQRRRWTWGNLKAIASRNIMPRPAAYAKALKYAFGMVSILASTTGAILLLAGIAKVPPQVHKVFIASVIVWFGSYAVCGWINAGGDINRERFGPRDAQRHAKGWHPVQTMADWMRAHGLMFWGFRILQTVLAALMCPAASIVPAYIISYSVYMGPPKGFDVIAKTRKK